MKFKDLMTPPAEPLLNKGEALLAATPKFRFNSEEEVDHFLMKLRREHDLNCAEADIRLDGETDGYIGAWGE